SLGAHEQAKRGIGLGLVRKKIEEVPLRHHADEFAARRQMREIRDRNLLFGDPARNLARFVMRELEKLVEESEFVEQLERGRMDRVTAKIAKEIRVLFEQDDIHAGARQKKSRHHARGPAARDAAAGGQG